MIAAAPRGSMPSLPDMYMRKMAVGPRARGKISLSSPVGDNIRAIAEAFDRMVNDVTAIVLDRPRHHDLIEEIRASGARIKLIQDGDVTASISAAVRGTNDHLAIGIGGTRQAVLSAAALRCLGGELQAQLWPTRRAEIAEAARARHRGHRPDLHDRRSRAAGGDRRGDRRLERRPAPRRPFPRRLGPDALARHVHALQLGALRRRDPLLRPRPPRGSPPQLAGGWRVSLPRHAEQRRSRRGARARSRIQSSGWTSSSSASSTTPRSKGRTSRCSTRSRRWAARRAR